jgi:hypothetical protein
MCYFELSCTAPTSLAAKGVPAPANMGSQNNHHQLVPGLFQHDQDRERTGLPIHQQVQPEQPQAMHQLGQATENWFRASYRFWMQKAR